jgi:hypothetical protein
MNNRTLVLKIQCIHCNKLHEVAVDPNDQTAHKLGVGPKRFAQNAYPYLSANDRELIISRQCGSCYDAMFPDEEDDS